MALAIDTKDLVERWIPLQEEILELENERPSSQRKRFQLHKMYAYATVHHTPDNIAASTIRTSLRKFAQFDSVQQAAMDWQADQDVDLDEMEVFHHLKKLAATSTSYPEMTSQKYCTNAVTNLLASAQSPSFTPTFSAHAQGRPPSSFHRYSVRWSIFHSDVFRNFNFGWTQLHKVIPNLRNSNQWPWFLCPRVVWTTTAAKSVVFWHLQLDYLDLLTPTTHPTSRSGKRRRTLNPFLQVSPGSDIDEETSRVRRIPQAKRFRGIRYRPERRTWVAEMKPPNSKNKVSFGDFKSQTQAARAIDAAFHHYGKLVNFPDTPQILSTRPTPAGLNEKDELRFVKEQGKWLPSMASTLPCTPTSATRPTLGLRSSPETTPSSSGGSVVNEEGQSMFQCSVENAIGDPWSLNRRSSSSVHIEELWDGPESSRASPRSFVNSPGVEHPCDQLQRTLCLEFLTMSPPAPMFQMESPHDFQGEVADALLEEQSFGGSEEEDHRPL